MRHGEDSAPVLDAGSGAEPGEPLGPLQREHVAYPFLGCEVHLVQASTLGGIMSGRWNYCLRSGNPTPICTLLTPKMRPSSRGLFGRRLPPRRSNGFWPI